MTRSAVNVPSDKQLEWALTRQCDRLTVQHGSARAWLPVDDIMTAVMLNVILLEQSMSLEEWVYVWTFQTMCCYWTADKGNAVIFAKIRPLSIGNAQLLYVTRWHIELENNSSWCIASTKFDKSGRSQSIQGADIRLMPGLTALDHIHSAVRLSIGALLNMSQCVTIPGHCPLMSLS
jgi:hypothetical protein